MALQSEYDDAHIIAALVTCRGNLSAAARLLKLRRRSLSERVNTTPDLAEALEATRDETIDEAETNIFDAVGAKDLDACKFVLRTIGRSRGYAMTTELTGDPNKPVVVDARIEVVGISPSRGKDGEPV